MASGNPNIAKAGENTRWKKGVAPVGAGKPKGSKHITTWIQELVNDEKFKTTIREGLVLKEYKGAPIKAMIQAQMILAINGDTKAFDSLAKYGWTQKSEVDNKVTMVTPIMSLEESNAISRDDSNQED